mgnify:CR=1 FL=1
MELGQPAVAYTPVLGAIWPHSRVWSTHMIALSMGNLWDMFGSQRTRFRIKEACWVCKGHTQSKPSDWEGWSFPRHCHNYLQSLRYPRDRLHNAQLWKLVWESADIFSGQKCMRSNQDPQEKKWEIPKLGFAELSRYLSVPKPCHVRSIWIYRASESQGSWNLETYDERSKWKPLIFGLK